MSTAQDPPVRRKQKVRRTKQLAAWRVKNAAKTAAAPAAPAKKTAKTAEKKPAAKTAK
jgi:hypothetical protein